MKKRCVSPPSAVMTWLTMPVVPRIFINSAPTTTQLTKCGRYMTVCSVRFAIFDRTSLIISARMMPIGKQMTTFSALMMNVLMTAWRNLLWIHSAFQFSRPTHGLFAMASNGLAPAKIL